MNQTRSGGRAVGKAAIGILGVGAASMLAGCAVTRARGEVYYEEPVVYYDEPVVEIEAAPVVIHRAPRYVYRNRTVFLVNGRWYAQGPRGRWVTYRSEPRELARYRSEYARANPTHVEFHGHAEATVRTRRR